MAKICFLGAGSTVFAKSVLGDCLHVDCLKDAHVSLVDIDPDRLNVSKVMMENIAHTRGAETTYEAYLAGDARAALEGADYVVNAIQVGGYEPSTVIDFEIPRKYGLRQTIADTLGIGGIFRALRTIPVMLDYCRLIEEVAPDAWLLNYTNPMAMVTGAIIRATRVKAVGLCHSVQGCAGHLCWQLDLPNDDLQWKIAGINHQGWLLEISRNGEDLYPEIRRRAQLEKYLHKDTVRFEIMKRFGYYVTESSEHSAEYVPWFIKSDHPELVDAFHIPLDEYPRRCISQIKGWDGMPRVAPIRRDPRPRAHRGVRLLYLRGHGDRRSVHARRECAQRGAHHQPPAGLLRGGDVCRGPQRRDADLRRRAAPPVRGPRAHQRQRARAHHRGRPNPKFQKRKQANPLFFRMISKFNLQRYWVQRFRA